MTGFHAPERYVLPEAVGSIVPARVASLILRRTDFATLRTEVRGNDPEIDAALMALHVVAVKYRNQHTDNDATITEVHDMNEQIGTSEAADLLGMTRRGVQLAIERGRIEGHKVGSRWVTTRGAARRYQETA